MFQQTYQLAKAVTVKAEKMIQESHYNLDVVRKIGENISTRWQQLMYHAEERMKLVMASMNWFKTAEQVRRREGEGGGEGYLEGRLGDEEGIEEWGGE